MESDLRITFSERELAIFNSALDQLEHIDRRKALSSGLRAGSRVIIAQGKANLASRNKVRKGNLRGSFGTKLRSRWKKIYTGFKRPQGAAAHLVDRGTKERWTKKGAYRGKVKGSMFWTDAVQSQGDKALDILMNKIIDEVNKIVD